MDEPGQKTYSLRGFIDTFQELLVDDAQARHYTRQYTATTDFALTGFHREDNTLATIDCHLSRFSSDNNDTAEIKRDYDSLLGFTRQIPIKCDILVCMLNEHREALTRSVHLRLPSRWVYPDRFPDPRQGTAGVVEPHKLPNMAIAKVSERVVVRAFFPGLLTAARAEPTLSAAEAAQVYDVGIRPASMVVQRNTTSTDWPVNYAAELMRAQNPAGGFAYAKKPLSYRDVPRFSERFVHFMTEGVPWAKDMFFMTQVRGTKGATWHAGNAAAAREHLEEYKTDFLIDDNDMWWIDVGAELFIPGRALVWRRDGHTKLLRHLLHFSPRDASTLANAADVDVAAHLSDVAGFRVKIDQRPNRHHATYLQAYTTDKSAVYHRDGYRAAKYLSGAAALKGAPPKYLDSLYHLYEACQVELDCSARVEVRVPLEQADRVLLNLSAQFCDETVLNFERDTWWAWRTCRLHAARRALELINSSSGAVRGGLPSLLLVAGLVWFVNGLHNRPDDGGTVKQLLNAIRPIDAEGNVDNQQGAFFFRGLDWPPDVASPAMGPGPTPDIRVFEFIFQMPFTKIMAIVRPPNLAADGGAGRLPTQKQPTKTRTAATPPPHAALASLSETYVPAELEEENEDDEDEWALPGPPAPRTTFEGKVNRLWHQHASDIMQRVGNPKAGSSYCPIPIEARRGLGADIFSHPDLSRWFIMIQAKIARDEKDWRDRFDLMWPALVRRLASSSQGWGSLKYLKDWYLLLASVDPAQLKEIRAKLWELFKGLTWIPACTSDRVWVTRSHASFSLLPLTSPPKSPAPQILFNWKLTEIPPWGQRVGPPDDGEEAFESLAEIRAAINEDGLGAGRRPRTPFRMRNPEGDDEGDGDRPARQGPAEEGEDHQGFGGGLPQQDASPPPFSPPPEPEGEEYDYSAALEWQNPSPPRRSPRPDEDSSSSSSEDDGGGLPQQDASPPHPSHGQRSRRRSTPLDFPSSSDKPDPPQRRQWPEDLEDMYGDLPAPMAQPFPKPEGTPDAPPFDAATLGGRVAAAPTDTSDGDRDGAAPPFGQSSAPPARVNRSPRPPGSLGGGRPRLGNATPGPSTAFASSKRPASASPEDKRPSVIRPAVAPLAQPKISAARGAGTMTRPSGGPPSRGAVAPKMPQGAASYAAVARVGASKDAPPPTSLKRQASTSPEEKRQSESRPRPRPTGAGVSTLDLGAQSSRPGGGGESDVFGPPIANPKSSPAILPQAMSTPRDLKAPAQARPKPFPLSQPVTPLPVPSRRSVSRSVSLGDQPGPARRHRESLEREASKTGLRMSIDITPQEEQQERELELIRARTQERYRRQAKHFGFDITFESKSSKRGRHSTGKMPPPSVISRTPGSSASQPRAASTSQPRAASTSLSRSDDIPRTPGSSASQRRAASTSLSRSDDNVARTATRRATPIGDVSATSTPASWHGFPQADSAQRSAAGSSRAGSHSGLETMRTVLSAESSFNNRIWVRTSASGRTQFRDPDLPSPNVSAGWQIASPSHFPRETSAGRRARREEVEASPARPPVREEEEESSYATE